MNNLIILILLVQNIVYAECIPVNIEKNKIYSFMCDGEIISQSCGLIKGTCEIDLNQKLKKYYFSFDNNQLHLLNSFDKTNAGTVRCLNDKSRLECVQENNCGLDSNLKTSKLFSSSGKLYSTKVNKENCSGSLPPLEIDQTKMFKQLSCKEELQTEGIINLENSLRKECSQIKLEGLEDIDCRVRGLIKNLKLNPLRKEIKDIFQKQCQNNSRLFNDDGLKDMNLGFGKFLTNYLSTGLNECNQLNLNLKNIDQLFCYKAEEYKTLRFQDYNSVQKICASKGVVNLNPQSSTKAASRESAQDPRNITGQPEKESFALPTEAPVIKNQETLQKIDKLIADNGGEMTPEVAKKAGEIFNSGIYQPTKNFLNSVEQAITGSSSASGASGTSGRSSSNFKSSNKSYEIGSKGGRTVANITEEVPSVARATALNGKMASGGSNMLATDAENPANAAAANREASTGNTQNDKKLTGNNFAGGQGFSGVGGSAGSGSSTSAGSAGFSSGGSADRNQELQQLPSLSSEEKSEITKVVQALKGAESPEDVKSIVTGEDNYQQVKRIVQELEQSKKSAASNSAVANGRNPASAQASSEVKEFEKTLEKFGIKVYGEAGPGKAVYAPTSVNHVIVIKSNSVQFLNTIRGKK